MYASRHVEGRCPYPPYTCLDNGDVVAPAGYKFLCSFAIFCGRSIRSCNVRISGSIPDSALKRVDNLGRKIVGVESITEEFIEVDAEQDVLGLTAQGIEECHPDPGTIEILV